MLRRHTLGKDRSEAAWPVFSLFRGCGGFAYLSLTLGAMFTVAVLVWGVPFRSIQLSV